MQSESQTARLRCISTGTLPDGECFLIEAAVSGRSRGTITSSKSMPAILAISQPRSDHEE